MFLFGYFLYSATFILLFLVLLLCRDHACSMLVWYSLWLYISSRQHSSALYLSHSYSFPWNHVNRNYWIPGSSYVTELYSPALLWSIYYELWHFCSSCVNLTFFYCSQCLLQLLFPILWEFLFCFPHLARMKFLAVFLSILGPSLNALNADSIHQYIDAVAICLVT